MAKLWKNVFVCVQNRIIYHSFDFHPNWLIFKMFRFSQWPKMAHFKMGQKWSQIGQIVEKLVCVYAKLYYTSGF